MYTTKTYPNGLRLIHNFDNTNKIVSVQFVTLVGGKDEDDSNRGIAHLAEHMFFKGTKTRSAKDITLMFDKLGITNNASTSQDLTLFYGNGLDSMTESIFDLLSDCFFNATYPKKELDNEKKVVCSELKMYLDDNRDAMVTNGTCLAMQGTPYEYVLGGTVESVSNIEQDDLIKFHDKFYVPNRLVISVSGNVSLDEVERLIEKYVLSQCSQEVMEPVKYSILNYQVDLKQRFRFDKKDTEQSYVFIGFNTMPNSSKDKIKCSLMLNALGGYCSSRLFQKVRDEKGLVYSVQAYYSSYIEGIIGIIFMCDNDKLNETFDAIKEVLVETRKSGFTEDELTTDKNITKTYTVMNELTPYGRANSAAKSLIYKDKIETVEQVLEMIDATTVDDLNEMFKKYFDDTQLTTYIISKDNTFDPIELLTK